MNSSVNSFVRRVMVDARNNVNDILWDTLQQLKVDKKLVKPSRELLTKFEGTETWPVGEVYIFASKDVREDGRSRFCHNKQTIGIQHNIRTRLATPNGGRSFDEMLDIEIYFKQWQLV